MEQKWWQDLQCSERGRWGEVILVLPDSSLSYRERPEDLFLLETSFFACSCLSLLAVSPGSAQPNTALCCEQVGSLTAWLQLSCRSPIFRQFVGMLPTYFAFFTAGLVYCVYILVQCSKCLSWFENKKNPIDSVKNFTDKRFLCFSPPRSCTRRAWAHACVSTGKDSSDVGLFLQLLAKCCQGKERELQMVYSHLQIKWLELLWFLADDT